MTMEIKKARQWLAVARLLLTLGRKAPRAFLGEQEENFNTIQDVVLAHATFLAQLEGRPLTAAKLSALLGIPRASVVRRMQALVDRGVVLRDSRGRFTLPAERMNSPETLANLQRAIAAVQEAAAELSILDSPGCAE